MPLTAQQENFAKAIVAGENQSAAYRLAYSTGGMLAHSIHNEASKLAASPVVTARIAELRVPATLQLDIDAKALASKLFAIVDSDMRLPVSAADKIAAIDKLAKLAGLYTRDGDDRHKRPVNITKVTLILDHGGTTERVQAPAPTVIDANGHMVPEAGAPEAGKPEPST